jgi:hypothetical protein
MKNSLQDGTRWEYFGEYPVEMGGIYYEPFLPCRAIAIKEIDPRTVQITVLRVSSWEPLVSEPLSSEVYIHNDNLEHYIKRRYLHD